MVIVHCTKQLKPLSTGGACPELDYFKPVFGPMKNGLSFLVTEINMKL